MISAIRSSAVTRFGIYASTIAVSALAASSLYERLTAQRLLPENFFIEFAGFCIFWLILDAVVCGQVNAGELRLRIFGRANFLRRSCTCAAAATVTGLTFQIGSFAAELVAFGALWLLLDRSVSAAALTIKRGRR
jgi:hypothetical protein